jgi:hypothetical protein
MNPLTTGIVAVAILLIGLFFAGTRTGTLAKDQRTWLDSRNLFIVASGLAAVLIGFLVILQVAPQLLRLAARRVM